jgi:hypothetical protein
MFEQPQWLARYVLQHRRVDQKWMRRDGLTALSIAPLPSRAFRQIIPDDEASNVLNNMSLL